MKKTTSYIQGMVCQIKVKVNQFKFLVLLSTPALYEPVNSIWQSIGSETLLLEKHFRDLSIDHHGAMNQNIFVVWRRV